ncbi:MAG: hypothetical protein SPI12_05870 [Actinomycetaceae bacterium]|nr:hypothetical protein [Actinomycetaceae bacterium]MDY6083365.1 hypothetical protein [Actinomycetaceae bacterium]
MLGVRPLASRTNLCARRKMRLGWARIIPLAHCRRPPFESEFINGERRDQWLYLTDMSSTTRTTIPARAWDVSDEDPNADSGPMVTFDREHVFSLFADFPERFTPEQIKIL